MAAPILLTSITGESCTPRTDIVQRNVRRAAPAEKHPYVVIVATVVPPTGAPTSLSQHETNTNAPIGAPDLRHQKDKPRLRLCSPSSSLPHASQRHTNLTAGPPLVLPPHERATHRVHRDCLEPMVRELEDGGGGQQPGAMGRRAAGLRVARARIPHWPRLPLRPRPRRGEASAYARAATGAWVFDVDETLLSKLPYYAQHGYGWATHACHILRSRACY